MAQMDLSLVKDYREIAPTVKKAKKIGTEMYDIGTQTDETTLDVIQKAINALKPLAKRRRVVYKGRHNYLVAVDGGIEENTSYNYRHRYYTPALLIDLFRALQNYGSYMLPVIRYDLKDTFEQLVGLVCDVRLCTDFDAYISDFEMKVPILKDNGVFQRVNVGHITIKAGEYYGVVHFLNHSQRKIVLSSMDEVSNLVAFEAMQDEIMRAYREIRLEIPKRAKRNEKIARKIEDLVTPYKVANRLAEN